MNESATQLTVFPERVLLPPALSEPLGALFQRLDEDRLGHLQRRRVSLPRLEVDRRKYVAVHGGIPEIAKTDVQTSFAFSGLADIHWQGCRATTLIRRLRSWAVLVILHFLKCNEKRNIILALIHRSSDY